MMHVDTLERAGVKVLHHFGGGTYAKETLIPAGCMLTQHSHPHDHLSILANGTARIQAGEQTDTVTGPACVTIPAGLSHSVSALTDVVWYCVHATDDTDPASVDTSILAGH